jgi:hypothetical protein
VKAVVKANHPDPLTAEIAVRTLDHDRIAVELEAAADYAGWARRLDRERRPDGGAHRRQFWRLLAVGSATLPVLTLASPMKSLEEAAGSAYYRLRAATLGAAFAVSSTVILTAGAVGADPAVTPCSPERCWPGSAWRLSQDGCSAGTTRGSYP